MYSCTLTRSVHILHATQVSWVPVGEVKGLVTLAHGLHEHALRYHDTACAMASKGYAVYAVDHIAHGKTAMTDGMPVVVVEGHLCAGVLSVVGVCEP